MLQRVSLCWWCRTLERRETNSTRLRFLSGAWFSEECSKRHLNWTSGCDLVHATIRHRKTKSRGQFSVHVVQLSAISRTVFCLSVFTVCDCWQMCPWMDFSTWSERTTTTLYSRLKDVWRTATRKKLKGLWGWLWDKQTDCNIYLLLHLPIFVFRTQSLKPVPTSTVNGPVSQVCACILLPLFPFLSL